MIKDLIWGHSTYRVKVKHAPKQVNEVLISVETEAVVGLLQSLYELHGVVRLEELYLFGKYLLMFSALNPKQAHADD